MDEQIKFADNQLQKSQEGSFPREFKFLNRDFVLHKDVFSPEMFLGYQTYIPHLPLKKGERMLDMGCGSGVIGITCCLEYDLSYVCCADISLAATQNTFENVQKHDLLNKIEVRHSDVFSNLSEHVKYDVIFWNFPYFDFLKPNMTLLDKCAYDPGYLSTKKFIEGGFRRLKCGGRVMLGFSSSRFSLEHARKKVGEIGYYLEVYYQGVDGHGIKQEILEVVRR